MLEELLEVAGGGLGGAPVAVADVGLGAEDGAVALVPKAFLTFEGRRRRVGLAGAALGLLAAEVRAAAAVLGAGAGVAPGVLERGWRDYDWWNAECT